MKPLKQAANRQPPPADSPETKLSRARPLAHQEDERPSAEDLNYGQTMFTRPTVPLPRPFTGGKRRKRSRS
jgi:hypothetical protein